MKKIIILIACFIALSYCAEAQITGMPQITKAVVSESGGVTLEWVSNTSPIDFLRSEVWYRNEYETTFTKIYTSESPYDDSYYHEHATAQADSRKTYYYVVNYNAANIPLTSPTIEPIYVIACYGNERIHLSWNLLQNTWTQRSFYIYRKISNQAWQFVDSTYNTSFQDYPLPGFENYSYKISYREISESNASISNITDALSYNKYKPISPCITSISVNDMNTVVLEWEKSPSQNVIAYQIYLKNSTGTWAEIDKVNSPDILTWTDINPQANFCLDQVTYAVVPQDICNETATDYPDSSKSTLVLTEASFDICNYLINIAWDPYPSMDVDQYEIYVSDDGVNFVKKAELPGTATNYQYTDLGAATTYFINVKAVNNRGSKTPQTATSCSLPVRVKHPKDPEFSFFRYVSVEGNDINICFEVDTAVTNMKYQIQRSQTGAEGSYQTIATLINLYGTPMMCMVDTNKLTQQYSYHYLLNTVDSCGHRFPADKPAQSILLKATENDDRHAELEWNPYDGFLLGLSRYAIYRYVNNVLDKSFLEYSYSEQYVDNSAIVADRTQTISYRVAAIGEYSSTMEVPDTAYSNIAILKRINVDIWFPDAFTPAGNNNKIFRPVYAGFAVSTYEFTIFDRYGAMVFTTNKPGEGWNGKIKGEIGTSGGYGYMLKMTTFDGDRYERRGTVILIN